MINFVSNLPQDLRSGGFSAMSAAAFAVISRHASVHYAGPINPPIFLGQKILSKLLRIASAPGNFFFYSKERLAAIALEVGAQCQSDARLDFFHGFTPWILTQPNRPYIAWSDCIFQDYIKIYHRRDQFRPADLDRIEQTEARWLSGARHVLFTSDWAAKRAVNQYLLDTKRVGSVGVFGEIEAPERDLYAGGKKFAFVSTNFEAKGGPVVLAAFRDVRKRHPDASLIIVGDSPSIASREPGLELVGFLRKEIPIETERLRQILGTVRALVHPTTRDVGPLTIVEVGYFGCPVISSKCFAIPELVDDKCTGLLLDDPSNVTSLSAAMQWMLEHEEEYLRMRQASWANSHGRYSKQHFEDRLMYFIRDFLPR